MKKINTQGIVLARTNYGEADRIITFLTPDNGKVKVIAKAVRKQKSKLAGGIELFSVSDIGVFVGRSEINTLASSRLVKHYGNIIKDIQRTAAAYEIIKITNKATESGAEEAYFNLLKSGFEALDDFELDPDLCLLWFKMQLIKLSGHAPNLSTDISGAKLKETTSYNFYPDQMRFAPKESRQGEFRAPHIKFLRLGFNSGTPKILNKVKDLDIFIRSAQPLVELMLNNFVHR